jgi:hypothetical protein
VRHCVARARGGREALHYKDWYEPSLALGSVIAGKRAAAVCLTQLSRPPVVRRSTQAGV